MPAVAARGEQKLVGQTRCCCLQTWSQRVQRSRPWSSTRAHVVVCHCLMRLAVQMRLQLHQKARRLHHKAGQLHQKALGMLAVVMLVVAVVAVVKGSEV